MHTLKFRTNICGKAGFEAVSTSFGADGRIKDWHVEGKNGEKILVVKGDVDETEVALEISSIGYKAQPVNSSEEK